MPASRSSVVWKQREVAPLEMPISGSVSAVQWGEVEESGVTAGVPVAFVMLAGGGSGGGGWVGWGCVG